MSVAEGRRAYIRQNTPVNERPIDPNEVKRSGIARGRAMFRARHGDPATAAASREAVELDQAGDDSGGPPTAA